MKNISKSALLVSAALLWWVEGTSPIIAMDKVDLSKLTVQNLPSHAKGGEVSLFAYLDSLKDGKNNSIIDGAKEEYKNPAKSGHLLKMKAAIDYLTTARTATKDYSEELEKTREQTKEQSQKLQQLTEEKREIEQKKDLVEKAFQQTTGLTAGEMEDFIAKLQKSLSGFSDALFLMKFSGDQNKDFSATLGKIIAQATASKKIKDDYVADEKIKKLEVYLQLPTDHVDTTPFVEKFKEDVPKLIKEISEKLEGLKEAELEGLKEAVSAVKTNFENIEHIEGFSGLTVSSQKKFREYRYGKREEKDEFGGIKENDKYKEIFNSAEGVIKFFHEFLIFLKREFESPLDFKEKFQAFKKEHQELLSNVFDAVIGEENTQQENTLLINKTGLSLYRYLKIQLDNFNIKGRLGEYISKLLEAIDHMRVSAFELANEIEGGRTFIKSGDATSEASPFSTNVQTLMDVVNAYEVAVGENALLANLQKFILPHRDQWVDYNKLSEFKAQNDEEESMLLNALEDFSSHWAALLKSRDAFYVAKTRGFKMLADIMRSNLIEDTARGKLIADIAGKTGIQKTTAVGKVDGYLSKLAGASFRNLQMKNTDLKNSLKLFDEQSVLSAAREDRNAKIARNNKMPGKQQEEEQKPQLTLANTELTGVMQSFVNTHPNLSFEAFWALEEKELKGWKSRQEELKIKEEALQQTDEIQKKLSDWKEQRKQLTLDQAKAKEPSSKIAQFLNKLSLEESKVTFKGICQDIFQWVKGNTPEKKSLTLLFEKVINAHERHVDFMKKIGIVKERFISLGVLPQYTLEEQSIEKKVNELKRLLEEKPGTYLLLEPEQRAINYAYNFLMFAHQDLQPLKAEMEIWGPSNNGTHKVVQLMVALNNAHKAYQIARDAIVAINPEAEDRGVKAKLFGGFDEEIQ